MRLWSLHPEYLDRKGLLAVWREALLAQKVLRGETKGYRNHPQLKRFLESPDPLGAIADYLRGILEESKKRGYSFDQGRIADHEPVPRIPVTKGQLRCEFRWLLSKLKTRDPSKHEALQGVRSIRCHPRFLVVPGEIESWERNGSERNE
jgi:hypothetical protein